MTTTRSIRLALLAVLTVSLLDLAAGFVWLGMGSAAAPKDVRRFEDIIALHDEARDGDKSALRPAIKALRRMQREDPWNAEPAAYLGSAYAIAARDGGVGPSRLFNVARAMHHLNAALKFATDSFEVRMVRASVQISLPSIFGRRSAAVDDAIVLDRMFRRIEDPNPAIASEMLSIYDFLTKAVPEMGNWGEGHRRANEVLKDAS